MGYDDIHETLEVAILECDYKPTLEEVKEMAQELKNLKNKYMEN